MQEEITVLLEAVLLVSGVWWHMWYSQAILPRKRMVLSSGLKPFREHSADYSTDIAGPTCIPITLLWISHSNRKAIFNSQVQTGWCLEGKKKGLKCWQLNRAPTNTASSSSQTSLHQDGVTEDKACPWRLSTVSDSNKNRNRSSPQTG